jgi:hypothetical protein
MFLGHVALGFAAKRVVPRISVAVLFTAAQFADVLWPMFVALGLEQVRIDPGNTAVTPLDFVSYPYSHSLLLLVVWGIAFGLVCRGAIGNGRTFLVIALLVISHWVLDFVTHRPDMPLYPGGPKLGLGLWNSVPGTIAVEIAMFLTGIWMYVRATRARDGVGTFGFWSLVAFLVVAYLGALAGPPPSLPALYVTALIGAALLTLWSWWVDRHRESV